jgi:hypothetical protein
MTLVTEEQEVLAKHAALVKEWKTFEKKCIDNDWSDEQKDWFGDDPFEETHWGSFTVGWFIGKGVDPAEAAALEIYL